MLPASCLRTLRGLNDVYAFITFKNAILINESAKDPGKKSDVTD